jgi:hypothetical protein
MDLVARYPALGYYLQGVTFPSLCGSFQIVSERERREDKCVLVLCVVLFDVKIEVVTKNVLKTIGI